MQDKIKHIESLYQSQLTSLNNWREKAIKAIHQEHYLSTTPLSLPPQKIISLQWKESENRLKELHNVFIQEKIINQNEQDFEVLFSPHFYEGQFIVSEIKFKNIKKALWSFYILQKIGVITNEYLHIVLPQHCSDKYGEYFNSDTLKTYLSRIRKTKRIPNFIQDILIIFPSESLPECLVKW